MKKNKKAFTLAETLIALVVLGIVAAITIPALVKNHIENSNRVKLKKSMSVYDYAFNKMTVENGIKGDNELNAFAPKDDCTNTSEYFKIAETLSDDNGTNCRFRTMDGTFWDISDIKKPIVALREDDLRKEVAESGTNRAFYLYAWFDNNGSIRVDDLAAISEDDRESLQALYDFINGLTKTSMEEVSEPSIIIPDNADPYIYDCNCRLDEDDYETCDSCTSTISPGNYKILKVDNDSKYTYVDAKNYCESKGKRLASTAEILSILDMNPNITNCPSNYTNCSYWTSDMSESTEALVVTHYTGLNGITGNFANKYEADAVYASAVCIGE